MKIFKHLFLVFALIFTTLLVGCDNKPENTSETQSEQISNEKVIDREGNEITLPEKTDKIISLAPSITETLVNLGLSDKLVAVDKYSLEIEGINKDLPIFDIMTPDAENIVALQPDIIFGTAMSKADGENPFTPMIEMGSFVTVVPTSTSIQGIIDDILFIGKVTKTEEKAQKIVDEYKSKIKNITDKIKGLDEEKAITVYFETSPMPNGYTFGKGTFLDDMLNALNVNNIFEDQEGWLPVSEEQVVEKNPNIIFTNAGYLDNPVEDIKNRAGWESIDAIQNNRVFLIDKNSSARANENSILAFEQMAKAIYPDLFK